jgi:hypothetical protein
MAVHPVDPAEPALTFCARHVRVHEYPAGYLAIFQGPHRLADYDPEGNPCDGTKLAA